tara:strand:- start:508 stop:774 length:267 start_codon:yes stop_codon:yes gene_type:complete
MNVKNTTHTNETAAQDVGTQPVASTERIVDARDLRHADVTAQARSSALLCASADGGDAEEEEAQRCRAAGSYEKSKVHSNVSNVVRRK